MNRAHIVAWPVAAALLLAATAVAQAPTAPPAGQPPAAAGAAGVADPNQAAPAGDQPNFTTAELEQMLASIALYPDSLISQVLMASTYPIEVVEADRWAKANANLKGDALAKELEKQSWDPSVRSLVNFPQVLAMMSENLSTTVKIGDAFIGQQKEVMDAIQSLRAKAKGTGNLESTPQQTVVVKEEAGTQVIVVESSSPDVIYVPQYNPTVVYGTWPYPAYPPYPYYPPGYVATSVLSFGVGVACGAAWGYAWGNCNWGGGDVDIDINRNTNINNNIDRSKFQNANRSSFKHDPAHRQGAAYRNQSAANRVGAGGTSDRAAQARNDYRGRAESGRSDLARGGADSFKGAGAGGGAGAGAGNRAGTPRAGTMPAGGSRDAGAGQGGNKKSSAISDASRGGKSARDASSRGSSSRQSSPSSASRSSGSKSSAGGSRSSGSRSGGGGASRGGGGGGRGGGGGGRGGGGRR